MEPAAFRTEILRHGIDKRRRVVVEDRLELPDALRARRARLLPDGLYVLGGNGA